jgi:signal transduction histidine kinase
VATIRDHGPGIADDQRDRVFERFTRLHGGSGDGTGLGLSVARGLAVGTGGTLDVVDPPGGGPGAAFALSLPAERIEEA